MPYEQGEVGGDLDCYHDEKVRPAEHQHTLSRLKRRLADDIDPKWSDVILILCFFCTGMVDVVAYGMFGCFVMVQTGNTIFVASSFSNRDVTGHSSAGASHLLRALIALLFFCLGAFIFATWHRLFGPSRRWVLMTSFALQSGLVAIAAALIFAKLYLDPGVLMKATPMLSFQSAGQIITSRILAYTYLPTVAVTTLYCDLMKDLHRISAGILADAHQNRRAASVTMLILGATLSGFLTKSQFGYAGVLWLVAGIKAFMVLAWFQWTPLSVEHADKDKMEV